MSRLSGSSLTETLVLALAQCQEQLKVIQQHSSRIDHLQEENERLAREIQDSKDWAASKNAREEADQTQELFQKFAEAQAEIHSLRSKLRFYKAKSHERLPSASPSPTSSYVDQAPPSPPRPSRKRKVSEDSHPSLQAEAVQKQGHDAFQSSAVSRLPPRKCAKTNRSEPVQFCEGVTFDSTRPSPRHTNNACRNNSTERRVAAIHLIAEDGENNASVQEGENVSEPATDRENPIYSRLNGLLSSSTRNKDHLTRSTPRGKKPSEQALKPPLRSFPGISYIQRGSQGANAPQEGRPVDVGPRKIAGDSDLTASHRPWQAAKHSMYSMTSKDPLRTQPVTELSLSSFKPNPRWLSSHHVSYDDFLNDRQHARMRILAETLPHLPGETYDHRFTDHELLMDLLGAGSEPRIASLTAVARQNLVLEARTKLIANDFRLSKQVATTNSEGDDPPGFWSTEMPSTQEAEENKLASRRKEREEVKRRYDDAMNGEGRWIFADE